MPRLQDLKLKYLTIQPDNTTDNGLTINGNADFNSNVSISSDLNVTGNTTITGDLTVEGTTTTIDSVTTVYQDPILQIGGTTAPASDDNKDRGISFFYYDGVAKTGFMGYDDSADGFTFLKDATISSEVTSGTNAGINCGAITSTGALAVTGTITGDTSLTLDSTTITTAEIGVLDSVTAGTAAASKALVLDANKDIGTIRNLTIDGTFTDGNYTFDTSGNVSGLGTVGCGAITSTGALAVTGTITGDTSLTLDAVTITTAEIGVLDSVTAGTAAASKALVLDANKDIGTIRNLTIDGTFSDGNYTFDTSGNVSGLGTVGCGAITSTGALAVTGVCRTNFKRYAAFTVDLSTLDGSSVNFTANDVLFNLGALDVTNANGITGTLIIIEKAIINVTTAAGTTLSARLDLSSDAGTAVNSELTNNTEVVGAGATYTTGGSTAADLDLNSAACIVITSNSQSAIAKTRLYLVTETALAADVTQGSVNISVEYSVL